MATYLPEDVVAKILSKLPPKSLLKFRSVSKSWLSLIGSPDFLSKNLLNNSLLSPTPTSQNSHLIIKRTVLSPTRKQIYSFLSYDTLDLDPCISQIPLHLPPPPPRRQTPDPRIVGSCNGLVCIARRGSIFLWNPATSALKALPHSVEYLINVSFGFDAKSNDLKVLRIYNRPVHESLNREVQVLRSNREAEVYSISSGCWRKLHVDVPRNMSFNSPREVMAYIKGVCFWLRMSLVENIESIVAFDMTQEVFKSTPLPDASVIGDLYGTHKCLTGLNDSLAFILFPQRQNTEKCLDIWVLSEFGVKESWTKLVTIRTFFSDLERPLGFWKNGELFMENAEGQLVLYDLFTQTVRNLHVDDGVKKSFQVFVYTPTSFPIDNM